MKKIACLFPGIGYTCDKPLLYYSWKLLKGSGWEIVPVPYTGFPDHVKGNPEKMEQCAQMALEQSEGILQGIDWNESCSSARASVRLSARPMQNATAFAAVRSCLRRWRKSSGLPTGMSLRSTGHPTHGRIPGQSGKTAGERAFRCMKPRARITRLKPEMSTGISKRCGK